MAIYGDMLSFFPELFVSFDYYSLSTKVKSGYDNRQDLGKITGIFQYLKKGELKRENDTITSVEVPTIWTRDTLVEGNFIVYRDINYRIVKNATWLFEGGFSCYILEEFVGNLDTQQPFEYVNLGQNSYA